MAPLSAIFEGAKWDTCRFFVKKWKEREKGKLPTHRDGGRRNAQAEPEGLQLLIYHAFLRTVF